MVLDSAAMSYNLDSTFPTLQNAPITEALIDIRTELPPDVDVATLRKFYNGLETRFPRIEERLAFTFEATLQANISCPQFKGEAPKPDGIVMRSDEEGFVVQARLDGFTVHKLSPYITWKSLTEHATPLWKRYLDVARPTKVKRLAVRYTNRIELPTGRSFTDFLLTVPELAPGIPQGLPEFFMRLVIPHPSGATAIVTEMTQPATEADVLPIIFDIDAFREIEIPATNESAIWATLNELRAYKNLIFFQTVTPTLLEKYK